MRIIFILTLLISSLFSDEFKSIKEKLIENGVQTNYVNTVFNLPEIKGFTKYTDIYLKEKIFVSNEDKNTSVISDHLKQYKSVYDLAEKKYKINREIVAALLLKETKLGSVDLNYNPISIHAKTLRESKSKKKRKNAEDAIYNIVLHGYNLNFSLNDFRELRSNKDGAIGFPQFTSNSLKFAVSLSGEAPNLNSVEDAILSVANYGHIIMEWDKLLDWNKVQNITAIKASWNKHKNDNGWITLASTNYNDSFIQDPILKKYALKIYKYNKSSEYVLSVLDTAYRISK